MIMYLLTALNLFGFVLDLVVIKAFSDVVGWVFCASLAWFTVFESNRGIAKVQNSKFVLSIRILAYSLGFVFTENETLGSLLILFTCILLIRINMHRN